MKFNFYCIFHQNISCHDFIVMGLVCFSYTSELLFFANVSRGQVVFTQIRVCCGSKKPCCIMN